MHNTPFSLWVLAGLLGSLSCSSSSDTQDQQLPMNDGGVPDGGTSGGDDRVLDGTGGTSGDIVIDAGGGVNPDVEVIITSDNAYGFGYGSKLSMINYFGGIENVDASDIFDCPVGHGPERYVVPASDSNAGDFLYVIAWADDLWTQGTIAQFSRIGGNPIYTGEGDWHACATGENYSPGSGGPSLERVNHHLGQCNAGTTPSGGWVDSEVTTRGKVAFGEDNTTDTEPNQVPGQEFPVVCGIDPEARWMWFNWDPAKISYPDSGSPFVWPGGNEDNPDREFLIFRLEAIEIPEIVR